MGRTSRIEAGGTFFGLQLTDDRVGAVIERAAEVEQRALTRHHVELEISTLIVGADAGVEGDTSRGGHAATTRRGWSGSTGVERRA